MYKEWPCVTPLMTRRRFLRVASAGCLVLLSTASLASKQSKLPQAKREQVAQSPAKARLVTFNGWMLRESDL